MIQTDAIKHADMVEDEVQCDILPLNIVNNNNGKKLTTSDRLRGSKNET